MVSFQIVMRKRPLTASAAPASTRQTSATLKPGEKPKPTIATPQVAAATTTAAPCLRTPDVHPLSALVNRLPTDIAEKSQPALDVAPHVDAMAGKSAIGIAKVIAIMSTTYVPINSGRRRAYSNPSMML